MDADKDTGRSKRRAVLLAGDAMLVAAVLIATSPWTSGAYTWLVQRRLQAQVASPAARPTAARSADASRAVTRDAVWDGWEREDRRDWQRAAGGSALGRLAVPKIGLDVAIVKGARDAELRRGPGWIVGTSVPGPSGNSAISGHRTTYLAPFRDIDRLEPGDVVYLDTRWRRYTYRVTLRTFADRDDVDLLFPTAAPTLTLTSCHPPYSDQFRIVVQARLASVSRR